MNDFTKTELEDLEFALITVYLGNSVLRKKISDMIDNYQESCEKHWPANMIKPCPDCKRHHNE